MYSKIERSDLRVEREQITMIAEILQAESQELLTLCIADKVAAVVTDKHKVADKALDIAKQNFKS